MQWRRVAANNDGTVTKCDDVVTKCDDAITKCDYAMAKCVLVPTGRHVVAMGVSPWLRGNRPRPKPRWGDMNHRSCRPFGTMQRGGTRSMGLRPWLHPIAALRLDAMSPRSGWMRLRHGEMCLVPTGRHVVAMGVSPWLRGNRTVRSPDGAT